MSDDSGPFRPCFLKGGNTGRFDFPAVLFYIHMIMCLKNRVFLLALIVVTIMFAGNSCKFKSSDEVMQKTGMPDAEDTITQIDIIKDRGKLVVVSDYNSTNYFIFRGTPMGYQFERAQQFADHLGVPLDIIPENNIDTAIAMLNRGECDIIAMDLAVNLERRTRVDFTEPHYQTRQMLVQRKPKNWRKMRTYDQVRKNLIQSPVDLARQTVHVQKNTAYVSRLENLMEEIGDTIFIVRDSLEVEQLIRKVSDGEIKYTVADEHVAKVNKRYFPDIDVKTPVSFPQRVAWAVKKGNDSILHVINSWQNQFNDTFFANVIYNKYFRNESAQDLYYSDYHSLTGAKISAYDQILKEEAERLGWDWRLIASMIYQESNFYPQARSWAGAYGLMQMMPATMQKMGIDSSASPRQQIKAGVRYIEWLDKQFKKYVDDEQERKKFVLAAYNVGIAHVLDAIRLAEKYERDMDVWDNNVAYFVLNKSNPDYYQDSVVYYGYARGEEPFNYVNEIYDRYNHYRWIIE